MNDGMPLPIADIGAPVRAIRGHIDSVNAAGVSGWCVDLNHPDELLSVSFVVNGTPLGATLCGLARPDVAQAGIANGQCGFHWEAPAPLRQADIMVLEALVSGTMERLPRVGQPVAAVPVTLSVMVAERGARAPAPPDTITVDQVDATGISGWVRCDQAGAPLQIHLLVDSVVLAATAADQARPDVKASGIDPGTHGFHIAMPDVMFDGQGHALALSVPELNAHIEVAAPGAFLRFAEGNFYVRNGILKGWIGLGALPSGVAELVVADGPRTVGRIPIEVKETSSVFTFRFELPYKLSDGEAHELAVNLRGTRFRLGAQGGGLSVLWRHFVMGRLEQLDKRGFTGWVYDLRTPSDSLAVELYDGENLLCRVPCELARRDVNQLFGIDGIHGFQVPFPASLYDGQARNISVRANGAALNLKAAHDVPLVLTDADLATIPAAERYQGFVELVNTTTVMGWAWDRKRADVPVHVAVYVDGELLETVQANRFNARLRNESRSGHHVFLVRLPAYLMNGAKRQIKVIIVEGNLVIEHETATTLFPLVDHFNVPRTPYTALNYRHELPANVWQERQMPTRLAAGVDPVMSLIVLNWNGAGILRDFLDSLLRIDWLHSYELLLIDHGSVDESIMLAREYVSRLPLRLIERGVNFSFSASNNYGASLARGQYLVFANNDLVLLHDCLAQMRTHLDDSAVGAVGLKLLEPLADGASKWRYITHHQGVQFKTDMLTPKGPGYYSPMEVGEQRGADLAACYDVPVATGALLMCRAEDFHAVGGFQEGYVYGMEDVDLCLSLRRELGKTILCDTAAVALHNRSATRDAKIFTGSQQKLYSAKVHASNRRLYVERHGRSLTRTILRSVIEGEARWRPAPLRVTIAVTSAAMHTPAGDFFTALELGEAMHRLYGWEVMFAAHQTHRLPGTDVLIAMRHDYAIEKISEANPGLITVAWIRNRVEQWLDAPYFQAYQLIFGSSQKSLDVVRSATGRRATLLPIASNARRFRPQPAAVEHASDVTFTGNYWGHQREAIELQDIGQGGYRFAIYGHGWQDRPEWRAHWRGAVPYVALPQIYCSTTLILDDAHPVTREWHSLNSRVFDALACGKLVLTNCQGGAEDLFGGRLPNFDTNEQLQALLRYYLDHPDERETLAAELHAEVLAHHTYDNRAATLRTGLLELLDGSLRFAIKIGVPDMAQREQWGDYHFALGIKRALEARGHVARVDILPDWYGGLTAGDDVVIVLRGLSQYQPQPTTINLMWLISHPDDVNLTEMQQYHHVFVASDPFTAWLKPRMGAQVSALLQCTDPALFYPECDPELEVPDTIFVGNSRGIAREVVQFGLAGGVDFAVYGGMWGGIVPASRVRATYLPNASLRHYYSGAKVVLNDHWTDMRAQGFVSNRLFDAGACGAAIVTDDMEACRALFGDAVHYYRTPVDLAETVARVVRSADGTDKGDTKLRDLILAHHTFQHRVDDILRMVEAIGTRSAPAATAVALRAGVQL